MRKRTLVTLAAMVSLAAPACNRDQAAEPGIEGDTLEIAVPRDVDERLEEAGEKIGGAVGEVMEETGEAIDRAGERVQEEMEDDTLDVDVDTTDQGR